MTGTLRALMVACLVGAVWVASPASPGSAVTPDQAARVSGGQMGYGGHVFALNASPTLYCAGSTYPGCGGGACGTVSYYTVSSAPGNRGNVTTVCSQKVCGGVVVSCGSAVTNACN